MLSIKRNKKGFTLVELIVVIAIMAVLAGTVAGVTVSQLNKQTDNTNKVQAKEIADTLYREMMDRAISSGLNKKDDNADFEVVDEDKEIEEYIMDVLATSYGTDGDKYNAKVPNTDDKGIKGKIFVYRNNVDVDGTPQYCISYFGKQANGKGNVTYTVDVIYGIRENAELNQASQAPIY